MSGSVELAPLLSGRLPLVCLLSGKLPLASLLRARESACSRVPSLLPSSRESPCANWPPAAAAGAAVPSPVLPPLPPLGCLPLGLRSPPPPLLALPSVPATLPLSAPCIRRGVSAARSMRRRISFSWDTICGAVGRSLASAGVASKELATHATSV